MRVLKATGGESSQQLAPQATRPSSQADSGASAPPNPTGWVF